MFKVILDTNILVSSLLTSGPPAAIIDLVADGKIIPFFNALILEEYHDVLSRKKFAFSPLQVSRLIEGIIKIGIAVENEPPGNVAMADKDDRIFYDTAKKVQAYLITGNIRHFPKESFVVTPAQFLTAFFS